MRNACAVLLFAIAACGSNGPAPQLEAQQPRAQPAPAACEQLVVGSIEALCARWEQHRRSSDPDFSLRSCSLDAGDEEALGVRIGIVTGLHSTSTQPSLADRYLVLDDGEGVVVIGELNELFLGRPGETWIGVQRRQIAQLLEGGAPELRLRGVTREADDSDVCLMVTRNTQVELVCGERHDSFRCWSVETSRSERAEISGAAHPMASVYSYEVAARCGPSLEARGLEPHARDEMEAVLFEASLEFRPDGTVVTRTTAGTSTQSLAELLDAAECPSTFID